MGIMTKIRIRLLNKQRDRLEERMLKEDNDLVRRFMMIKDKEITDKIFDLACKDGK